ncbi:MAG: DUF5678 domain-containing protein [Candidatus Pacearchaeota archaeon]|nr:DUF5678 domain-containing protein [Candidatus Pacearchaeota archaeon]
MDKSESSQKIFAKIDLEKYEGKWVAICELDIICYGENAKTTFEEAQKKCKNKKIIIARVPEEGTMIY